MTAVIPSIHVENKKTQLINSPGNAGKVAVIGAFDTLETNPQLFMTVGEAQTAFGKDSTYNGCAVVEDLFYGAESLLAVNITTESEDPTPVREKELTTTKLTNALSKIKGEDFDILFVAATLTDTFLPIITTFLEESYGIKYPVGYVGCLAGATTAANVASAALAGEFCFGLITQQLTVGAEELSLLRSAAYYTGVIASMQVGNTMTMKEVPGVTAVSPELSFETGGDGKALLEAGITTFKVQDRGARRVIVVNSEQPNGLDLYINRVRNYIVKEFALHEFLGERNNDVTINEIKHEVDRVRDECVNVLNLLEDIKYTVAPESPSCVGITVDSLIFAGIITRINVYVRVEVE